MARAKGKTFTPGYTFCSTLVRYSSLSEHYKQWNKNKNWSAKWNYPDANFQLASMRICENLQATAGTAMSFLELKWVWNNWDPPNSEKNYIELSFRFVSFAQCLSTGYLQGENTNTSCGEWGQNVYFHLSLGLYIHLFRWLELASLSVFSFFFFHALISYDFTSST